MPYSRQDILTQNINTYPNNNSGQITPDSVKTFNQNWIDSVVFTDQTGSLVVVSASYANNAGNAQTAISASRAVSASFATNANTAISATTAISASFATTASFLIGNVANAVTAQTASFTPNAVVTASAAANIITFTKGDNTTFTVIVAQSGSVASASYANVAQQAASASYASNADLLDGLDSTVFVRNSQTSSMSVLSSSYANYSNNLVSDVQAGLGASILNIIKGGATTSITINDVNNAMSASFALTASYALNAGGGGTVDTGSLVTTSSFNAYTASINSFTSSVPTTYATKAEVNSYTGSTNAFTASMKTYTGSVNSQLTSLQAYTASLNTYTGSTTSQFAGTASFATTARNVVNGLNITASNITVLNNLTVNGTASFAYTKTTTGSAVIIGDEFIILNADTPTAPFAGIQVYDTGSNATASFEWNGNGDYWIVVEETGQSAGILTGPLAISKGAESFPTLNKLTKGTGTTSITDSNITDNGTNVSINSNTTITGSLGVSGTITGTISGTASFANNATSASYAANAQQATSASFASTAQQAISASFASTASFFGGSVVSASYAATASGADVFTVRTALTASGLNYPTTDGLEGQVLKTDGTNDLAFGDVNTIYETVYTGENITKGDPLYISGSQGANAIVYRADAGDAAKMPATYIASETITAGTTTRGIVLGVIEGIDLTGYAAGTEIGVAVGGGWTSTRPTGSAIIQILGIVTKGGSGGKGLVLNPGPVNLPNIFPGYTWIGGANGYPVATSTGSINAATAVSASFANNAGAAQTAISSSFATNAGTAISASFASTAAASQTATSASYASNAQTAFSATSASYADNAGNAATANSATSASYASNAQTAFSATSASFATSASYSATSQQATSASFATSASYAPSSFDANALYSYTFLLMGA